MSSDDLSRLADGDAVAIRGRGDYSCDVSSSFSDNAKEKDRQNWRSFFVF
jgi:hypothetical protein